MMNKFFHGAKVEKKENSIIFVLESKWIECLTMKYKWLIMKKLVAFLVISIAAWSVSAQDLIVTTNGDHIPCLITKMDSISVEYQIVKNGFREKNTLPRKYVADFRITDKNTINPVNVVWSEPKISRFRWAFSFGYANRWGKDPESSGNTNFESLLKKLRNGLSWENEIQYYFNQGHGIALNISGVHTSASERGVNIPGYGHAYQCKIKQQIIYIGPAWAIRHETDKFLYSGSVSLGPLFCTETLMPDNFVLKMTAVSFGMNCSIGGEYILSPNWGLGLKFGYTIGTASNFDIGGQTVSIYEPVSLSSLYIAMYFSFRAQ